MIVAPSHVALQTKLNSHRIISARETERRRVGALERAEGLRKAGKDTASVFPFANHVNGKFNSGRGWTDPGQSTLMCRPRPHARPRLLRPPLRPRRKSRVFSLRSATTWKGLEATPPMDERMEELDIQAAHWRRLQDRKRVPVLELETLSQLSD
jgi:hypothetical protein